MKKNKLMKIAIAVVAIALILIIVITNIFEDSMRKYAATYVFLYGNEISPTPTPDNYTNDPCECVYLGKKVVNTNTSTGSTDGKNSNAGQIVGKNNEEKVWNYLCGKYDELVVAGIMGNLWVETGGAYDPTRVSRSGYTGIAQWDKNTRFPRLKQWCSSKSYDPMTLNAQLEYIPYEMKTYYNGIFTKFKKVLANNTYKDKLYSRTETKMNCRTYNEKVEVLAVIVARYYEACVQGDGLQDINNRVNHAKEIYKKYNSKKVKDLDVGVQTASNITETNIGLKAFAKKSTVKKTTTGKTSGTGGTFKAPTFPSKDYEKLIKTMLPGAVAAYEYYGIGIITSLAQTPWEGGWAKIRDENTAKSKKYCMYGLIGKNLLNGSYIIANDKQVSRGYSDYSEAGIDHARNFYHSSSGGYQQFINTFGTGYKNEINALKKTGYLGVPSNRESYGNNIIGTGNQIAKIGNFEDVNYCKQVLIALGLETEYANACKWVTKYESLGKTKTTSLTKVTRKNFGNINGKTVGVDSTSNVDISDVKTAQKLLKFTDSNMDKKIETFTFEADLSKCEKANFEVYMPQSNGRYKLNLVNSARSFGQSDLKGIVVHHTLGGGNNLNNDGSLFFGSWNNQSLGSHFGIASNGKIYQWLPIDKVSAAQNDNNSEYLSIEVGDDATSYSYTKKAYKSLVHLVAYLCVELNVDITCNFQKNKKGNLYWDYGSGLMRHYDCKRNGSFRGKACPSNWSPADGSVESNEFKGVTLTSKGGNNRWLAFKADVYRYIANHQKDSNFKISGIKGLSTARKLSKGHDNEFDWSNVDSLLGSNETTNSGNSKKMWLCDCEIPCPKCHCHDNETSESDNQVNNSNSSKKDNNNTTGDAKTESDKISNVARAIVKGHCNYIKKHNIPYDASIATGRYAQKQYSTMKIDGKQYKNCRRDCSGFMTTIVTVLGDYSGNPIFTSSTLLSDSAGLNKKWTLHSITSAYKPKKGDILVEGGHTEMYYDIKNGHMRVWNWGSENNYSKYISNGYNPINSKYATPQSYTHYWRRNTIK